MKECTLTVVAALGVSKQPLRALLVDEVAPRTNTLAKSGAGKAALQSAILHGTAEQKETMVGMLEKKVRCANIPHANRANLRWICSVFPHKTLCAATFQ